MKPKYVRLNDRIYRYVCACRSGAADPILDALQEETAALGDASRMQISPEQGTLMTILVAVTRAKSALEVGTFTGYSSICIARGLPKDGRLICLDASATWTAMARRYWDRAGVAGKIRLHLGDAIKLLRKLPRGLKFDFVFIDAAKEEYDAYYELILPRVRRNGLILFDNMLWGGRLGGRSIRQAGGRALDRLNRKLARDSRVECVMLSIGDGIQLCRKL